MERAKVFKDLGWVCCALRENRNSGNLFLRSYAMIVLRTRIYMQRGAIMQTINIIQKTLDYIEDNLTAELTIQDLAAQAGFSPFYYERIFKQLVGIPVMSYLTRRRLLHAACAISKGAKVINTALLYGFDTSAGFYKAFVREFGCAPSSFSARHTAPIPYPIKLRQEDHIMITKKTIEKLLPQWNMTGCSVTDFYHPGTDSRADNLWQVGENFLLKVTANKAGLIQHNKISRALTNAGFHAALPVPTIRGEDYLTEGQLYFCMTKKLPGDTIASHTLYSSGEIAFELGVGIGRLDSLLQIYGEELVLNEPNLPEILQTYAIPASKSLLSLPEQFYDNLVSQLVILYPKLPRQLIHRDPNSDNILWQGKTVTGFLDFELSEKNIRIFDPCYAATAVLSDSFMNSEYDRETWPSLLHKIIAGYDSIVALSLEEKQAIPYVIFAIQLICISFFSRFEKHKRLADINADMLTWLVKNQARISII